MSLRILFNYDIKMIIAEDQVPKMTCRIVENLAVFDPVSQGVGVK